MFSSILSFAILPMLTAALVVVVIHPSLVKIARKKRLLDRPNARKLNQKPIPMLGGVGVLCGIFCAVGVAGLNFSPRPMHIEIIIALVIMLYTGVGDDILDFSPTVKFALQVFAAILVVVPADISIKSLGGLWGLYHLPSWLAVGFTVFVIVGIINAINLIDGIDGLCALFVMSVSLTAGVYFTLLNDMSFAVMAFATTGALLPFLLHNLYGEKYKMFLGDGGSLSLGLICALFAVRIVESEGSISSMSAIALAFALLALPVCDTLRVMTSRMMRGYSPFRPDKSHLHHMLLNLGMTHQISAIAIVLLSFVIIFVWGVSVMMGADAEMQLYCVVAAGLLSTWGIYYAADYAIRRYPKHIALLQDNLRRLATRHTTFGELLRRVLNDKI